MPGPRLNCPVCPPPLSSPLHCPRSLIVLFFFARDDVESLDIGLMCSLSKVENLLEKHLLFVSPS